MALNFDVEGDLPAGIHRLSVDELWIEFGNRRPQRTRVSQSLDRVIGLARLSGKLERFIVFGSYVTIKDAPGDADVFMVMSSDFEISKAQRSVAVVFDPGQAEAEFGAHVFWVRANVGRDLIDTLLEVYSTTRDGKRRGLVEVRM